MLRTVETTIPPMRVGAGSGDGENMARPQRTPHSASGTGELDTDDAAPALVLPVQPDEFTCGGCFLVHHRSRLADPVTRRCRDCC
jgi:hypothetical protein